MLKRFAAFLRQNWKIAVPAAIVAIGLALAFYLQAVMVQPTSELPTAIGFSGGTPISPTRTIKNGYVVEQTIDFQERFSGFGVRASTYQHTVEKVTIHVEVLDASTGMTLTDFSQEISEIISDQYFYVDFPKSIYLINGQGLLRFSFEGLADRDRLVLMLSESEAVCTVKDTPQNGELLLLFMGTSAFAGAYFWWIAALIIATVVLAWWLLYVKKAKPQTVFLVAAIGLGLLFSIVFPPYSQSDATTHIPLTQYYSSRLMGGDEIVDGTFKNRAEDNMAGFSEYQPKRGNYHHIAQDFFRLEENPGQTYSQPVYTVGQVYQYFPQTLGVTVARLLHLGQVPTLYFGMWFSLAAYIAAFYFIIRLAPFKALFTLIGLVPFSLHTAASYSYDTSIIVLCTFFLAYVLRVACGVRKMRWYDFVILCAAAALLAPLKYIYLPVLLTVFIIPADKWPRPWVKKAVGIAAAVLGCLAVVLLFQMFAGGSPADTPGNTPWLDPEGGYTYGMLFSDPLTLLRLLGVTTLEELGNVVTGLGAIQYNSMPLWISLGAFLLMLLAVMPPQGGGLLPVRGWQKAFLGVSYLGVFVLALFGALTWTYIGAFAIRGMQGRYFVPLLPALMLLFANGLRRIKLKSSTLVFIMVLLNSAGTVYLFLAGILDRTVRLI